MPKDYEKEKQRLLDQGMPIRQAKKQAAIRTNLRRKKRGRPPAKFHR